MEEVDKNAMVSPQYPRAEEGTIPPVGDGDEQWGTLCLVVPNCAVGSQPFSHSLSSWTLNFWEDHFRGTQNRG